MARLAKRNGPIAGLCTEAVFFLDAIGRLWHPLPALLGQVVKRRAPTPKFDFSTIYWKPRV